MILEGTTILVADDEPILTTTFCILLQQAGARVLVGANGREALEHASSSKVDALICDKQMPEMDGMTLLHTLHSRGLSVPTLLFVSGIEPEDDALLRKLHVRMCMSKPTAPAALISAVAALLGRCEPPREALPL